MWKELTIFIHASLISCSVSTNLTCDVQLADGNFEDFEPIVLDFHYCIPQFSGNEFKLTLKNYSMPAFPDGTFSNLGRVHSFKLRIEGNSKLQLLFPNLPGFSLFANSWFHSVAIYIADLSEMIGWRWTALFELNITPPGGLDFTAVRSKLLYLHSDFGRVANGRVIAVRILKCQLRWLGRNVFAPLRFLKTIELRDNLLEAIDRSHLPAYAPELKVLDLGNNKLTSLPEGFVDGLNIETIYLRGNNIKITETQAQAILSSRNFPTLFGVLWPCLCKEYSKLKEKFKHTQEVEICFKDDDFNINSFQEICNKL